MRRKRDFHVEQNNYYKGRFEMVLSLFNNNSKSWNVDLVQSLFLEVDAQDILTTPIPQCEVPDKIAWVGTKNGAYTVKSGYHFWFDNNVGGTGGLYDRG